jgi:hypothetical protein
MILTIPNDMWRLMLPFSSILTFSATCKEMRVNAAFILSNDKQSLSRYISSLACDENAPCMDQILEKLQGLVTKLDLTLTRIDSALLRKIDQTFCQVSLTLQGNCFTDENLPQILEASPTLTALTIDTTTCISILGLIDVHLPRTIQKIGGLTHLMRGHSLVCLSCAATSDDPMQLSSLFIKGYCHLKTVYEEEHIEGRDLMKKVLKLAPFFVDAMVALGRSLLTDTDETEEAKKLLERAITLDPTNKEAEEALCWLAQPQLA